MTSASGTMSVRKIQCGHQMVTASSVPAIADRPPRSFLILAEMDRLGMRFPSIKRTEVNPLCSIRNRKCREITRSKSDPTSGYTN